jgi:beta-glucosidase
MEHAARDAPATQAPSARARRRATAAFAGLIAAAAALRPAAAAAAAAAAAPPAELLALLPGGTLPPAPSTCTESIRRAITWGVATSAAQIEGGAQAGGRTPSIWDAFAARSPSPVAGGATPAVAADHVRRYEQDFDLMQSLGIRAHRFSISWSRLVPGGKRGSPVSAEGAAFYRNLARAMVARGIAPVATLYHWDLPQSLQDAYGGWLDPRVVGDFEHYASAAFAALDGLVEHWLTINEPGVVADQGYNQGTFAPGVAGGRRSLYACGHNLLLAHAAAVARCRAAACGRISLAMNVVYYEPADPSDPLHARAAQNALDRESGWFLDPIFRGDYPAVLKRAAADAGLPAFTDAQRRALKGSADFLAINTYTGYYAYESPGKPDGFRISNGTRGEALAEARRARGAAKGAAAKGAAAADGPAAARDVSLLGSAETAAPGALGNALRYLARAYGGDLPLWVTEFGTGVPGEHARRGRLAALDDRQRIDGLSSYLEGVCAAAASGEARVEAVFAWTFLDNFEWLYGYTLDYGLVDVDFVSGSLARRVKASGYWFSRWFFRASAALGAA